MKKLILIISAILLTVLLNSCPDSDQTAPSLTPVITSVNPQSSLVEEVITIKGTKFKEKQGTSFVSFMGTNAKTYLSWSDTLIKVKVPTGAVSGKLWVVVGGEKSNDIAFQVIVIEKGTVKDIDGNVYNTVKIGNQWWMAENLNVSRYRNGDYIQMVTDQTEWSKLKNGAWCYYDNETANGNVYHKIYNGFTFLDPRGLAPEGWHIPTDDEWRILTDFLGGEQVAGGKLKETGTSFWKSPNTGATNSVDFSALPGGYRDYGGNFVGKSSGGYWWSSTTLSVYNGWCSYIGYNSATLFKSNQSVVIGYYVRCVKD